MALRWSEWMVHDRLDVAREIDERLPQTWQALAEGRLSYNQAHDIAAGTLVLTDPAAARWVEDRVLAKAATQTRAETRRMVERAVIKADPVGAEERRRNARKCRSVGRSRDKDGMANLHTHGPAEDIAVIDSALDVGADQLVATGQAADLDQGRFDTLLSWASDYLRRRHLPGRSARPTKITLITKHSAAAGADDDPGELVGFGPVTAQVVRDLLAGTPPRSGPFAPPLDAAARAFFEAQHRKHFPDNEKYADDDPDPPPEPPAGSESPPVEFRVVHVDPDTGWALPEPGRQMDFGRTRRFATAAQARHVRDRDRTCAIPICAMPAHRCEIDHRDQYAEGGCTDVTSLGLGCTHHNRTTRNRSNWKIVPNPDGSATLITPQGRRYPITPHDYLD